MSEERCPPPKFAALEIDEGIVSMYSCVSSDTCALGGRVPSVRKLDVAKMR